MGYFTLPLAKMVGPSGKVVAVDAQEKMIHRLVKRAVTASLQDRIDARVCSRESLGLGEMAGRFDFALAFHVVHEVPDAGRLFSDMHELLKTGGTVLVAEPSFRVSSQEFEASLEKARRAGFVVAEGASIWRSRVALLTKR